MKIQVAFLLIVQLVIRRLDLALMKCQQAAQGGAISRSHPCTGEGTGQSLK